MSIINNTDKIYGNKIIDLGEYFLVGGYLHEAQNLNPIFGVIYSYYTLDNLYLNHTCPFLGKRFSNKRCSGFTTHFIHSKTGNNKRFYEYDPINGIIKLVLGNQSPTSKLQYVIFDLNKNTIKFEYDNNLPYNSTVRPSFIYSFEKCKLYFQSSSGNYLFYLNGTNRIPTSYYGNEFKVIYDDIDIFTIEVINSYSRITEYYIYDQSNVLRRLNVYTSPIVNLKILTTHMLKDNNNQNTFISYVVGYNTTNKVFEAYKNTITISGSTNPSITKTQLTIVNNIGFPEDRIYGNGTNGKIIDTEYISDGTNEYLLTFIEKRHNYTNTDNTLFYGVILWLIDNTNNQLIMLDYKEIPSLIRCIPYDNNMTEFICHSDNGLYYLSINYNGQSSSININQFLSGNIDGVMIDEFNRIFISDESKRSIDIVLPSSPVKIEAYIENVDNIEFSGQPIDTNLIVNIYDFKGNRLSKNIKIDIIGSAVFSQNNSKTITITTDNTSDTIIPITITDAGFISISISFV